MSNYLRIFMLSMMVTTIAYIAILNDEQSVWAEESVPWEVEMDGSATTAGVCEYTLKYKPGSLEARTIKWTINVPSGATPEQKAEWSANELRRLHGTDFTIEKEADDDDYKIIPRSSTTIITDGFVSCQDGQDGTIVKDDPTPTFTPVRSGFFSVIGTGMDPNGTARFGLGTELPLIEVSTYQKTGTQVAQEMSEQFNSVYIEYDYVSEYVPELGGVHVAGVPCPLGVYGGVTDGDMLVTSGLLESPMMLDYFSFYPRPYMQVNLFEISSDQVVCNAEYTKYLKHNGDPICVLPDAGSVLEKRGFATIFN